jgi:hypothetical protein
VEVAAPSEDDMRAYLTFCALSCEDSVTGIDSNDWL